MTAPVVKARGVSHVGVKSLCLLAVDAVLVERWRDSY
jgi:hypothetical protein